MILRCETEALYRQIKGLGGFRNILIHRYLGIDPSEIFANFHKGLTVFPRFAQEVLAWLDEVEGMPVEEASAPGGLTWRKPTAVSVRAAETFST